MSDEQITFSLDKPMDTKIDGGYLEGKLLVATPKVSGDFFAKSVIYLFAHNASGAMGLVINKPVDIIHYTALLKQLKIEVSNPNTELEVFHGGPVEEYRGFVIHSSDYSNDNTLSQPTGICITTNHQILNDIAAGKGPEHKMLVVGYAGWSAGQLDKEIAANSWIIADASPELIFSDRHDQKWIGTAEVVGVDMGRFSYISGHA